MSKDVIWVVAAAIMGSDDLWLMHRRPYEKAHGGLWEFPGGKVEGIEIPTQSLVRELHEELGINVHERDCEPAGFAQGWDENREHPIVILLYKVVAWEGEPNALEGGAVAWCARERIAELQKPPLDQQLAAQLFPD